MLKSRLRGAIGLSALTLSLVGALGVPAQAAAADETLLLTLTNATRTAAGVPALALDSQLSSVARQWANSMAAAGAISHNTNLRNQVGSNWSKVGENVGYGGTVQVIYEALLNSPSHLRNILDPEFERVGLGVIVANNTVWLVQVFLTPRATAPAPEPAAVAAPERAPAPTTTAPAPTTTTTSAPTTTTTTAPPASTVAAGTTSGLPLRLTLMVQQVRTLGVPK